MLCGEKIESVQPTSIEHLHDKSTARPGMVRGQEQGWERSLLLVAFSPTGAVHTVATGCSKGCHLPSASGDLRLA